MTDEQLYITEKPSVALALADYFERHGTPLTKEMGHYINTEKNIVITWLYGHILTAYEPEDYNEEWKTWWKAPLPMVPDKFLKRPAPQYKDHYKHILLLLKDAHTVINAADPDREGQVLCDEVTEGHVEGKIYKRLLLNALDDTSITRALEHMEDNEKFKKLYEAGQTRENIDWLIGMNLTRFFTNKARDAHIEGVQSIGRVKSPATNMVVERELEIENFKPEPYFNIFAYLNINGQTIKAEFETKEKVKILSEAEAIVSHCSGKDFTVQEVNNETKEEKLNQLYSLDTLQIDADKVYGISAKDTLAALQKLYEAKLTSYPRSDCKYLPESQRKDAPEIAKLLNDKLAMEIGLIPVQANNENLNNSTVFNDKKITAHHAIIPTKNVPDLKTLKDTEKQIYLLIVRKYAGIFVKPYKYTITNVRGKIEGYPFKFRCKKVIDGGFTLYEPKKESAKEKEDIELKSPLATGQRLPVTKAEKEAKTTEPPKRYTEGSLIQAMTNAKSDDPELSKILTKVKGIGTPATRADIINKIIKVDKHIQKKGKSLSPTVKGRTLIEILPDILKKPDYTAMMEQKLTGIEEGTYTRQQLLKDVVAFVQDIVGSGIKIINKQYPCPKCHNGYLQYRKFKDKYTGDMKEIFFCNSCGIGFPAEDQKPKVVICPECKKGLLIEKKGKYGKFYGCNNYPDCKYAINKPEYDKLKGSKF